MNNNRQEIAIALRESTTEQLYMAEALLTDGQSLSSILLQLERRFHISRRSAEAIIDTASIRMDIHEQYS